MGYGLVKNGKQQPITPWKGSWAEQEQQRRESTPWLMTEQQRREREQRQRQENR